MDTLEENVEEHAGLFPEVIDPNINKILTIRNKPYRKFPEEKSFAEVKKPISSETKLDILSVHTSEAGFDRAVKHNPHVSSCFFAQQIPHEQVGKSELGHYVHNVSSQPDSVFPRHYNLY